MTRFSPGFIFPNASAAAIPLSDLNFQTRQEGKLSDGDNVTWTFADLATGTANANRWVIALVMKDSGTLDLADLSIGGVAATFIAKVANRRLEVWAAKVPTGTTATVVFHQDGSSSVVYALALWTVFGTLNTTLVTLQTFENTTTAASVDMATVADGLWLGVVRGSTNSFTWDRTGKTTGFAPTRIEAGIARAWSTAGVLTSGADVPRGDAASMGGTNNNRGSAIFMSFTSALP